MTWTHCAAAATVIFDKAARAVEREDERLLSVQTYVELLQCAENRKQHMHTTSFLADFGFRTLLFTENIGHRAAV